MTTLWSWTPGPPFETTTVADPARTWSRKLWGGEIIFAQATITQPGGGDLIVSCTFNAPESVSHSTVRAALRRLRFDHPSIASTLAWGGRDAKFVYEAPRDEADVTRWLDSIAFVRDSDGYGSVEATLDALRADLGRADALRTPHELKAYHITPAAEKPAAHGLLLYLRHIVFDGVGAWEALGCLMEEIAQVAGNGDAYANAPLDWGTEHARLARPVSDRIENEWRMEDLHGEWPIVKRMHDILGRPSSSFGLPIPNPDATPTVTDWVVRTYPKSLVDGLVAAGRKHGAKIFAIQCASILLAYLRVSPPTDAGEARVTLPYNPVNLRPRLTVLPPHAAELVSAIGFNALEAADLLRFADAAAGGDAALAEAVWTLAGELQKQLAEQDPWQGDMARTAPMVLKTLAEAIFTSPPPSHPLRPLGLTNFGVLDAILKPSYPIPSSASGVEVTGAFFHGVSYFCTQTLLPVLLHAYSWQGQLHFTFSYSPAFMGPIDVASIGADERKGAPTLGRFIGELERIMSLLAEDQ